MAMFHYSICFCLHDHVHREHQNVHYSCSRLRTARLAGETHADVALQQNCYQMIKNYLKCGSSNSSHSMKSVL